MSYSIFTNSSLSAFLNASIIRSLIFARRFYQNSDENFLPKILLLRSHNDHQILHINYHHQRCHDKNDLLENLYNFVRINTNLFSTITSQFSLAPQKTVAVHTINNANCLFTIISFPKNRCAVFYCLYSISKSRNNTTKKSKTAHLQ